MNQFLGSIVITVCIIFSFFFIIRYTAVKDSDPVPTVEFVDRSRAVFVEDQTKEDKNFPFVIEALVHQESIDTIILDVMYSVPKDDGYVYILSIRPERSDFKVEEKLLKPGVNMERMTVFFNPKSPFKRRVATETLTFYISAFGDREVDKNYTRKASFVKAWRKQRYKGYLLKRSEYYTK